ncbi:MAG TPA: DUF2953 domain-containing protein [Candidatus Agathobaculum merdipullorum]|nr:DUF2953 domain-containing protein [Candidatus Agathobaculum merdipullorum]
MSVLLVILAAVLGLVLVVLLLILLLLCVRIGVDVVGVNGEVSAEVRYGPVRIPVWPPPRRKKAQPPSEQQADEHKPRKKRKKKKYRYSLNREQLDIGDLADMTHRLHSELTDAVHISRLRVRVVIGTDDAAKTGILLGQSAAVTGMMVPFLENTFTMEDYHVDVDADFEADHTEWAFTVFGSLRPLRVLWCLLRHSGELYRMYKRMIKKEEAITHE